MTRWNWQRWVFALVTGAALSNSFATLASDDMPLAGETITLKFPGQADRAVTVLKSTRKLDGSLETVVKDAKSGESLTLVDPAPARRLPSPAKPVAAAPVFSPPAKPAVVNTPVQTAVPQPLPALPTPKPAPIATATLMPPMAPTTPTRVIGGGKLFNREPEGGPVTIPHTPAAAAATPVMPRKAPTPATALAQPSTPVQPPYPLPKIHTNQEPPRAQSVVKPVTPPAAPVAVQRVVPPTPIVPQIPVPSSPDTAPVSQPTRVVPPLKPLPPVVSSLPAQPAVAAPSLPVPPLPPAKPTLPSSAVPSLPAPVAVPTIPTTPVSKAPIVPAVEVKPVSKPEVVKPVVHMLPAEVEPHAKALKDALAPSARLKAAKELATGSHANSAPVQALLLHTAKTDPCPAVKADCIEYLAKNGYRDPAFVAFVKAACSDESGEVRMVAKDVLMKLSK